MITIPFQEQDYYSTEEMAAELGVTKSTIIKWRQNGKIPADAVVRHGYGEWHRRDVIDPMINAGMLEPVPPGRLQEHDDPPQESLIKYENLELLPEHYERYIIFHRRYAAGIFNSSIKFGLETFGPLGTPLKLPPPSIQTNQPIQPTTEENTMTIETYSESDIAEILEVPGQRVRAWKRRGVIPASAVTDDGRYKKNAIDRLIENGTLAAPEPEPEKPVRRKAAASKSPEPSVLSAVAREEFVQGFWSQQSRASKVLSLPPETSATIVRIVNEALQYGHEWFSMAVIEGNQHEPETEGDENFQ